MSFPRNLEELEEIKKECKQMVTKRAIASGLAALSPGPVDIPVDVALLMELLPNISKKFGLSKEQIDEYEPQLQITIFNFVKKPVISYSVSIIFRKISF